MDGVPPARSARMDRSTIMIKKRSSAGGARRIRLKPHNSFDLIRLIAHGQSDARKAVAELVQNALDGFLGSELEES